MHNVLFQVPKSVISMAIRTVAQPDQQAAIRQWRQVADSLRDLFPKAADCTDTAEMDSVEEDVMASMGSPKYQWSNLASMNCLEGLFKEIKRSSNGRSLSEQRGRGETGGRGCAAGAERRMAGQSSQPERRNPTTRVQQE
jgi:hypothetical protein